MIKEVIVVEGRDDITAVKAAVDAEVIATHGYAYGKKFIDDLKVLSEKRGIIILTDPDYMGEKIRRHLAKHIPGCKHAFLKQSEATKKDDIGVENATPETIRAALEQARPEIVERREIFDVELLAEAGLTGGEGAASRRALLCELLKIGHCNGKQLLKRLNHFGVTPKDFFEAMEEVEARYGK